MGKPEKDKWAQDIPERITSVAGGLIAAAAVILMQKNGLRLLISLLRL
jgi:hypothetical protein